MTDWIELVLGEDEEEAEDEERPALDGVAEVRRPVLPGQDGAEEEPEPDGKPAPEKPPEWMRAAGQDSSEGTDWAELRMDGTDQAELRMDGTDRAGLRTDGTDRAGLRTDGPGRAELRTGGTDWVGLRMDETDRAGLRIGGTDRAGLRRDRTDWAGLRTDGTDWAKWTAEAGLEGERPEWTQRAEGAARESGEQRKAGAEAVGAGSPGPALRPDRGSSAALMELYRGAAEGARAPAPALSPERVPRTMPEREAGGATPLTVEELDRAVRRDSRRYDGGMSIF